MTTGKGAMTTMFQTQLLMIIATCLIYLVDLLCSTSCNTHPCLTAMGLEFNQLSMNMTEAQ
jgi:hypothetical protein